MGRGGEGNQAISDRERGVKGIRQPPMRRGVRRELGNLRWREGGVKGIWQHLTGGRDKNQVSGQIQHYI